jgi:DNA-directed RNA polymerase specialized sigma24 family protein
MSTVRSGVDLDDIEVAKSSVDASLAVVERLTRQAHEIDRQKATAIRLAKANGASLRDIAKAADVSAQTVANICNS